MRCAIAHLDSTHAQIVLGMFSITRLQPKSTFQAKQSFTRLDFNLSNNYFFKQAYKEN